MEKGQQIEVRDQHLDLTCTFLRKNQGGGQCEGLGRGMTDEKDEGRDVGMQGVTFAYGKTVGKQEASSLWTA